MNIHELNETGPWEWPENADDIIFSVLIDRSAGTDERLLAAELVSEPSVMNDKIAAYLIDIIKTSDEEEDLRCQAAISLGPALEYSDIMEFDNPEEIVISEELFNTIRQQLKNIYKDHSIPIEVKRCVLEAAVRAPMEWQAEEIKKAYEQDDDKWRMTAVFCMGYAGEFKAQILDALDDQNPDIFYEAVVAAGNCGIQEAWSYIKPLLADEDTEKLLLLAAIEASANINPEEAIDYLTEYTDSEDEDLEEAASDAMSRIYMKEEEMGDPEDEETVH